ncbi:MAG: hypothetical protein Kow00104_18950 [Rhodothalassiaceae bacterium]
MTIGGGSERFLGDDDIIVSKTDPKGRLPYVNRTIAGMETLERQRRDERARLAAAFEQHVTGAFAAVGEAAASVLDSARMMTREADGVTEETTRFLAGVRAQ